MFTRLSLSFGNLEPPNQNRDGCGGGARLASSETGWSLVQKKQILAYDSEQKGKEGSEEKEPNKAERLTERKKKRIRRVWEAAVKGVRLRREVESEKRERKREGLKTYRARTTTYN